MSNWSQDEVNVLKQENGGGNAINRATIFAKLPPGSSVPQKGCHPNETKEFVQRAYNELQWHDPNGVPTAARTVSDKSQPNPSPPRVVTCKTAPLPVSSVEDDLLGLSFAPIPPAAVPATSSVAASTGGSEFFSSVDNFSDFVSEPSGSRQESPVAFSFPFSGTAKEDNSEGFGAFSSAPPVPTANAPESVAPAPNMHMHTAALPKDSSQKPAPSVVSAEFDMFAPSQVHLDLRAYAFSTPLLVNAPLNLQPHDISRPLLILCLDSVLIALSTIAIGRYPHCYHAAPLAPTLPTFLLSVEIAPLLLSPLFTSVTLYLSLQRSFGSAASLEGIDFSASPSKPSNEEKKKPPPPAKMIAPLEASNSAPGFMNGPRGMGMPPVNMMPQPMGMPPMGGMGQGMGMPQQPAVGGATIGAIGGSPMGMGCMRGGMGGGMPGGMAGGASAGMPGGMPGGMLGGMPGGVPGGMPGMPGNMTGGMANGMANGMAGGMGPRMGLMGGMSGMSGMGGNMAGGNGVGMGSTAMPGNINKQPASGSPGLLQPTKAPSMANKDIIAMFN